MGEIFVEAWHFLRSTLKPAQICWACLLVTTGGGFYVVETFARNTDVSAVRQDLSMLRVDVLEQQAFDLRVKQCEAIRGGQRGTLYRERLQSFMALYRKLTGTDWPLPECNEV